MNSFRYLERGVEAEIERQRALLEAGGQVEQETLHFDPRSGSLTPLRSKEYSHDYRYFPEPDLPPLAPSEEQIEAARDVPAGAAGAAARALRVRARADATSRRRGSPSTPSSATSSSGRWRRARGSRRPSLANWVTGELAAAARAAGADGPEATSATPEAVASLAAMVAGKELNRGAGRRVIEVLAARAETRREVAERLELLGGGDEGELEAIVERGDRGPARGRREGAGRARARRSARWWARSCGRRRAAPTAARSTG